MKKTYKLSDGEVIMGNKFYSLLDFCFEKSAYFTFKNNQFSHNKQEHEGFLNELSPFLHKHLTLDYWHGYPWSSMGICLFDVYVYFTHPDAKDIIKKHFDNLYFDTFESGPNQNCNKPDDLCFFVKNEVNNKNEVLLATLSHELLCHIYVDSDELLQEFSKFGNWEQVKEFNESFVCPF